MTYITLKKDDDLQLLKSRIKSALEIKNLKDITIVGLPLEHMNGDKTLVARKNNELNPSIKIEGPAEQIEKILYYLSY